MVQAVAALGVRLSKSQVDRDFRDGAPRDSARAFLTWRAASRELGRTADSRIDRTRSTPSPAGASPASQPLQTSAPNASASEAAKAGIDPPAGPDSAGGEPTGLAADAAGETPADADDTPGDEHTLAYRADRARNERIKAERAQLELDRERGAIVAVRDVEELEFTAGRIVRDRIQMVPARAAADLHALVLTLVPEAHRESVAAELQLHAFERRLDTLLRDALIDAATAIENARRGDDEPD